MPMLYREVQSGFLIPLAVTNSPSESLSTQQVEPNGETPQLDLTQWSEPPISGLVRGTRIWLQFKIAVIIIVDDITHNLQNQPVHYVTTTC